MILQIQEFLLIALIKMQFSINYCMRYNDRAMLEINEFFFHSVQEMVYKLVFIIRNSGLLYIHLNKKSLKI